MRAAAFGSFREAVDTVGSEFFTIVSKPVSVRANSQKLLENWEPATADVNRLMQVRYLVGSSRFTSTQIVEPCAGQKPGLCTLLASAIEIHRYLCAITEGGFLSSSNQAQAGGCLAYI